MRGQPRAHRGTDACSRGRSRRLSRRSRGMLSTRTRCATSSNGKSQKARTASSWSARRASSDAVDQDKRVVEITIETARKRVPVIAGAGSNSRPKRSSFHSMRRKPVRTPCSLCATPGRQQADAGRALPALQGDQRRHRHPHLHLQYPGRSGGRHECRHDGCSKARKNIAGAKDATANLARPSQRLACRMPGKEFIQLSGEDATALGFMAHDKGASRFGRTSRRVSRCSQFQNACLKGDYKTALDLQDRPAPLHDVLFIETNPAR